MLLERRSFCRYGTGSGSDRVLLTSHWRDPLAADRRFDRFFSAVRCEMSIARTVFLFCPALRQERKMFRSCRSAVGGETFHYYKHSAPPGLLRQPNCQRLGACGCAARCAEAASPPPTVPPYLLWLCPPSWGVAPQSITRTGRAQPFRTSGGTAAARDLKQDIGLPHSSKLLQFLAQLSNLPA